MPHLRSGRNWHLGSEFPAKPPVPPLVTSGDVEAGRLLDSKGNLLKIVHYRESVPFGFTGSKS